MKLLRYLKSLTFAAILFPLVIIATIASSTYAGNTSDLAISIVQSDPVVTELKNLSPMKLSLEIQDRAYSPLPDPDFNPTFELPLLRN